MKKNFKMLCCFLLILVTLFSFKLPSSVVAASSKQLVVYFPNWAIYNAAHQNLTVGMIPWSKVTAINHAFFEVDSSFKLATIDSFADFDKWMDHSEGWDPGQLRGHMGEYKYYKTLYPDVKLFISVGGWTRGQNFHAMAQTAATRGIFIQSVVDFLKQYPFVDGIDIDWEYPGVNRAPDPNDSYDKGCPGGPEDKQNYTALLRELRQAFNNNGLSNKLLTAAIAGGYDKLELQEPDVYHQYLDWLNVMTFDYHGAWEKITNNASPLYANPDDPSPTAPIDIKNKYNCDYSMRLLRDTYGIPASKLNMATPYYSRGWKGVSGGNNGLFANATGPATGSWDNPTAPGGQYPYFELKAMENRDGYVKYRDPVSNTPYLYNASAGIMLTYEDEISLAQKCDYINSNGFGGLMVWEISGDDPSWTMTNLAYNKLILGGGPATVATPTFSPAGGSYATAQTVSISCATSGATIRYTTDGSEPNTNSEVYSNPIYLSSSTTLKAKAFKSGMNDSATASATYTIGSAVETVATPTFSPAGGTYDSAQSVTISCATPNAIIRYTTDGSEPTSGATQYSGPITVTAGTTTIKAKAFLSGMNDSATVSATYTINSSQGTDSGTPSGPPAKPSLSHNNWSGNGDYVITMDIWWGNNATSWRIYENDQLIYTGVLQGNSPNSQRATYQVTARANGTYTYKVEAVNEFSVTESDTMEVRVTNGSTVETVATPTFSPAGGSYATAQTVSISCATSGATIRYTTDGSEPNANSAVYSTPLFLSVTTTVKAKAFKSGANSSATASATYTIGGIDTVATPTFSPAGGTYSTALSVTISCATNGASIRYTTDGSEPNATSTAYSGPLEISSNATIKAKAFKLGMNDSATASATYTIGSGSGKKIIGYVYGTPGAIDARKLTHVNYAFAAIVNGRVSVANPGDLAALVGLKSQNPDLKVILSVGGWGAEGFSDAALTDASRTAFADSCLQVIQSNNLDGIDLDWEYPVNGGWGVIKGRPEDKQNFTLLLQKVRDTIGYDKILSIASGAGAEFGANTELDKIAMICDYINIMTYDFGANRHNANLYQSSNYGYSISCDDAVKMHLNYGVPAAKINLGVPFYGRYGSNWPSYAELKASYINKNGWVRYWDDQAKACYLMRSGEFITYDDPETLGYKTAYIKDKGLGGAMFWQYNHDPSGELLNALWTGLNSDGGDGGDGSNGEAETVATPVFTPGGGTYSSAQSVTISCGTIGAIIRYTTDGSEPTAAATQYTGPITVSSGTVTIKAKAFKAGMNDSAVASAGYTISSSGGTYPAWAPDTPYQVGDIVSYGGINYTCRQSHTSLTGWEPPNVPALWSAL